MTCPCGRPTVGVTLCDTCRRSLEIALANISAYWCDLDTVKARLTRYGAQMGGRSADKALPIDARFAEPDGDGTIAQDAVRNTIATWTRVVLDHRPLITGPVCERPCLHLSCSAVRRSRPPRDNVPACCRYLLGHADWMRTSNLGPDVLDELQDCERQLRRLVDSPPQSLPAGPCDGCGDDLRVRPGALTVDCGTCGMSYDMDDRRQQLLRSAEDRLASAANVARAVSWLGEEPLTHARVRKWVERGRLIPRGHEPFGIGSRALYRIGDAIDLLASDARRKVG